MKHCTVECVWVAKSASNNHHVVSVAIYCRQTSPESWVCLYANDWRYVHGCCDSHTVVGGVMREGTSKMLFH